MKIQEWDDESQTWIDISLSAQPPPKSCNISFGEAAAQIAGSVAAQYLPDILKDQICGIYEEYKTAQSDADIA
jgi:hypothetical protein